MWSRVRVRWGTLGLLGRWFCSAVVLILLVPLTAGGLAFTLSRLLRSSAAGWGDLIGAVLGVYLGVWVASVCVFTVSARLAARSWWFVVLGVAAFFPSLVLGVGVAAQFAVPLPAALVVLVLGVSLVAAFVGAPRRSQR